jgi:hypothetical protein
MITRIIEVAQGVKLQNNNVVSECVIKILNNSTIEVTPDTALVGSDSVLDSLGLVELCLMLEDIAKEAGGEFDWTSDAAMSNSRSIFRSISSLQVFFDSCVRS